VVFVIGGEGKEGPGIQEAERVCVRVEEKRGRGVCESWCVRAWLVVESTDGRTGCLWLVIECP